MRWKARTNIFALLRGDTTGELHRLREAHSEENANRISSMKGITRAGGIYQITRSRGNINDPVHIVYSSRAVGASSGNNNRWAHPPDIFQRLARYGAFAELSANGHRKNDGASKSNDCQSIDTDRLAIYEHRNIC